MLSSHIISASSGINKWRHLNAGMIKPNRRQPFVTIKSEVSEKNYKDSHGQIVEVQTERESEGLLLDGKEEACSKQLKDLSLCSPYRKAFLLGDAGLLLEMTAHCSHTPIPWCLPTVEYVMAHSAFTKSTLCFQVH